MRRIPRSLAPLALAALALTAAPALAQSDKVSGFKPSAQRFALDISFPGGTLQDFVEAIKAAVPENVTNVLLRHEAATLEVPPMELRSVSTKTAFELAVPTRGQWTEPQPDGSSIEYYRDLDVVGGDAMSAPVFVVDAKQWTHPREPVMNKASPEPRIDVFSVEKAVKDDADVKELLTAIDTALALGESDSKAEVKFHPDSALLIVRGTPDQISTIDRVIERFRETGSARTNEHREKIAQVAELKANLIERRADMQRWEAQLELDAGEVDRLKQLAEKEIVSDKELHEAAMRLRMSEAEVQAARARYDAAEEKMKMLGGDEAGPKAEARVYTLTAQGWKAERVRRLLDAADGISEHIVSVQPPKEAGGVLSTEVEADEDGHMFVKLLLEALDAPGNGGKP
ncbi:MAG: hypothetical protein R3B57_11535 [Phycisphaerales bacterium]